MENIIILVLAALFILLVIKIFKKPLKFIFKLLLNAALGFVLLFAVNYAGSFINLTIEINFLTCLIAGTLGPVGIVLILVYIYLL